MYLAEVNKVHDFDSNNLLRNNLAIFEMSSKRSMFALLLYKLTDNTGSPHSMRFHFVCFFNIKMLAIDINFFSKNI